MTLRKQLFLSASSNISKQDFLGFSIQSTLEYLINVDCAFILFKKIFALCGLIRYCAFILFEEKSRPVRRIFLQSGKKIHWESKFESVKLNMKSRR